MVRKILVWFGKIRGWFGESGAAGLLPRLGALALVALLVGWQAGWAPLLAQTITGRLGAPDATTTLSGNQLPAPALPFGGVIKDGATAERAQRAADHHR